MGVLLKRSHVLTLSLTALTLAAAGGWWLMRRPEPRQPPAAQPPRFAIVDVRGQTILAAEQIVRYDWRTHVISLQPGAALSLRPADGEGLVHGIPFLVMADGEVCYRGVVTSLFSSVSHVGHVIDVNSLDGKDGVVRIEFRRPGPSSEPVIDARSDRRVRDALRSLGKLNE
jgi:hypothetical protein